jgi:hypothetical protein
LSTESSFWGLIWRALTGDEAKVTDRRVFLCLLRWRGAVLHVHQQESHQNLKKKGAIQDLGPMCLLPWDLAMGKGESAFRTPLMLLDGPDRSCSFLCTNNYPFLLIYRLSLFIFAVAFIGATFQIYLTPTVAVMNNRPHKVCTCQIVALNSDITPISAIHVGAEATKIGRAQPTAKRRFGSPCGSRQRGKCKVCTKY